MKLLLWLLLSSTMLVNYFIRVRTKITDRRFDFQLRTFSNNCFTLSLPDLCHTATVLSSMSVLCIDLYIPSSFHLRTLRCFGDVDRIDDYIKDGFLKNLLKN